MNKIIKDLYLCVDMGDLIYSLLFVQLLGIEKIFIDGGCGSVKFNWDSAKFLMPFIKSQPYFQNKIVEFYIDQSYDYNYGLHPDNMPVVVGTNLTEFHASKFDLLNNPKIHHPWLSAPLSDDPKIRHKKILINRTHRYHGNDNFYYDFLKYFHPSYMLFVGLETEYNSFMKDFGNPNIEYIPTNSCVDLATIINSIPIFLGNQSLICSIATGLGKTCYIEYGKHAANYLFSRQNIFYF